MATGPYALIGDGRLATSLGPYLDAHGAEVRCWSRRAASDGGASLGTVVADCPTVLLAIRDDAVADFAAAHRSILDGRTLVHFSGARRHDGIAGCHPLASFGRQPMAQALLADVLFVTERNGPAFGALFPMLSNPNVAIAAEDRARYHALAVLSGNLSAFVWNETARVLPEIGVDPATALGPYLRTLIAAFENDPTGSLTGPVARGDRDTIAANLAALDRDPPLRHLYEAFREAHARAGGAPDR